MRIRGIVAVLAILFGMLALIGAVVRPQFPDRGVYDNRPASPPRNTTYIATDCTAAPCTSGGGSSVVQMLWNGQSWVSFSGSGGGGGGGSQTLGSVVSTGRVVTDMTKSTQSILLGDGVARWAMFVSPEDGPTLKCEADSTGAACQRWQSRELFDYEFFPDGTFCTGVVAAIVNSTQLEYSTCGTINAAAALRTQQLQMPANWDGGAVRMQVAWSDPDGANALAAGDVVFQCRGDGEAWGNNWSSLAAVDTTLATANAITWSALTAATTPAGTCAKNPRTLWIEWRMDASNFAAAATNARFHGARLWYQTIGEGLLP